MAVVYQKDRVYSLIVGNEGRAISIDTLQIKFNVQKSFDNTKKKNSAWIEIYNLSTENQKLLDEEYVTVRLDVGYADQEKVTILTGQVVNRRDVKFKPFNTKRSSTDVITRLEIDELFVELNTKVKSTFVPEGGLVKDIILNVIQDIPEITRNEMNGVNISRHVPDGYPISGEPRRILDDLSKKFGIRWQIDQGVLYVSDEDNSFQKTTEGVPLIGQMSGLYGRPEFVSSNSKRAKKAARNKPDSVGSRDHIKIKMLLNPTLVAGGYIKLDYADLSGYYKIDELTHEGSFRSEEWWSTILCTQKVDQ